MDKEHLLKLAGDITDQSPKNYIQAETNSDAAYLGMRLFERPVTGVAAADDEAFEALLAPAAIGPHFMRPEQWLPGARSVISFFLPLSDRVKDANKRDKDIPALEWLYGRIEGQMFINEVSAAIRDEIIKAGHHAVSPSIDERFDFNVNIPGKALPAYTSNWSERHVAYVCGLGTFGLNTCIITELGTAGRFFSVVTDMDLEPTARNYTGLYDYCIRCGVCLKKCPAGAFSKDGKSNRDCSVFMRGTSLFFKPRYGCGKCQVGVPCENTNPCVRAEKGTAS
ncbi:4Fe-4S binding domain-containing protein [Sporobacter termitidis DSM 10068]|uniref:4Fe-4S binding domain-containing protein n=1 Tax=Sporobacter termitidis DSM 10068 TaxID=1123282 RepID=A0A1M5WM29_9FIRM|nr:4Fe-4S binding protein [Sporobacter termitidis]SHH88244.1 4Fe-4S binding domain-containing protein [Sporobacter termitidis DSM 10068]